jgi:hypothetical protein
MWLKYLWVCICAHTHTSTGVEPKASRMLRKSSTTEHPQSYSLLFYFIKIYQGHIAMTLSSIDSKYTTQVLFENY